MTFTCVYMNTRHMHTRTNKKSNVLIYCDFFHICNWILHVKAFAEEDSVSFMEGPQQF